MKILTAFGIGLVFTIFIGTIITVTTILLSLKKQNDNPNVSSNVIVPTQNTMDSDTCVDFTDSDGVTCDTHCNNSGYSYAYCIQPKDGDQNCYEDTNVVHCECSNDKCEDSSSRVIVRTMKISQG